MNPPANRRSQSRVSAKRSAPAAEAAKEAPMAETIEPVETPPATSQQPETNATSQEVGAIPEVAPAEAAATSSEAEALASPSRQSPIPTPSHPRQYRAIGLVMGKFEPSDEKITQGVLQTADGAAIDTVLLGRMISLVKKHIDLAKSHLWVVYPRSRQEDDKLHLQISGIWEPETLHPQEEAGATAFKVESGYFSIRGEVVFYSLEKEIVIVKIRQSAKKEGERAKFFKIKLKGSLPDRPLRNFWDLQVQLQGETLTIVSGTNLGLASKQRKPFKKGERKPWSKQPRKLSDGSVAPPTKPTTGSRPSFQPPIKKRDAL